MSDAPGPSDVPTPATPPAPPAPPAPPGPPSPPAPSAASPGWYPDPFGRFDHRWYDGYQWTDQVSANGMPMTDPQGLLPSPPGTFSPAGDAGGGRNGIAIASLVCGIIAVLIAWIPLVVIVGIVLAILALTFGVAGLRRSRAVGRGRGQAITGLVTGGLALALAVVGIVLTVLLWREVGDFLEPGAHDATVTSCSVEDGLATAAGTLTNESTTERDYTLFVEVDGETEAITLEGVGPGRTVEWRAAVRVDSSGPSCTPDVTVNGPFPFGIELDPID